jgi:hypothetical protein
MDKLQQFLSLVCAGTGPEKRNPEKKIFLCGPVCAAPSIDSYPVEWFPAGKLYKGFLRVAVKLGNVRLDVYLFQLLYIIHGDRTLSAVQRHEENRQLDQEKAGRDHFF